MASYYRDKDGNLKELVVKGLDTLPAGTIVSYDGDVIPDGYVEVGESGEVYSIEETRIGTWIDGKPLYRKVFILPSGTQTTAVKNILLSSIGIIDVDEIYVASPSYYTLGGARYPFSYNDGNAFAIYVDTTKLSIFLQYADIANSKCLITIEYTKTTD